MVKVIVVANNKQLPPVDFRKEPKVKDTDIICRIGDSYMLSGDRTDILFLRKSNNSYSGVDKSSFAIKADILRNPDAKYIAINTNDMLDKIVKKNKIKIDTIISSSPIAKKYGVESPSSGLIVIDYLLETYPMDQIYIVNFSWQGWQGHSWDTERQIIANYIKKGRVKVFTPGG